MKTGYSFKRRGPDMVTLELATVLGGGAWFEFKPLFAIVYSNLRARKCAGSGEEMLRLRAYDKLQNLVQHGSVEKKEKNYRGNAAALDALKESSAAEQKRAQSRTVAASPSVSVNR